MSIKRLQELLNSDRNSIRINKDLLKTLDLEEAVLYSFLVYEFDKNSKHYEIKYFNDDKYFLCSVDDVENELNLSAFRQRNALNKLQDKNLLEIKLGQYRTRYIHLNENPEILERILYCGQRYTTCHYAKWNKFGMRYLISQILYRKTT